MIAKTSTQLEVEAWEASRAASLAARDDQMRRAGLLPGPAPAAAPAARPAGGPAPPSELERERILEHLASYSAICEAPTPEQRRDALKADLARLDARLELQRQARGRCADLWREFIIRAARLDTETAWSRLATFGSDILAALPARDPLRREIDCALMGTVSAAIRRRRGTRRDGAIPIPKEERPWLSLVNVARCGEGDALVLTADLDILGVAVMR